MASAEINNAPSISSIESDKSTKTNEEIVDEMAGDFSNFLNLNIDKEEKKFHDSVEMMLTKLDEFFSLVDMIRSDTSLCLTVTVPDIHAKCAEMEATFARIDKLEAFVSVVRQCVSATEEKVSSAESELGSVRAGGLVKKLTSFMSKKKTPAQKSKAEYVPVDIFSTNQYFGGPCDPDSSNTDSQQTGAEGSS